MSSRPVHTIISKVLELIDPQHNCWKRQVVQQIFQPEEANLILQIPLQVYHQQDQLVWSLEKKGGFAVKTAYQLAYSIRRGKVSMLNQVGEKCGREFGSCQ